MSSGWYQPVTIRDFCEASQKSLIVTDCLFSRATVPVCCAVVTLLVNQNFARLLQQSARRATSWVARACPKGQSWSHSPHKRAAAQCLRHHLVLPVTYPNHSPTATWQAAACVKLSQLTKSCRLLPAADRARLGERAATMPRRTTDGHSPWVRLAGHYVSPRHMGCHMHMVWTRPSPHYKAQHLWQTL